MAKCKRQLGGGEEHRSAREHPLTGGGGGGGREGGYLGLKVLHGLLKCFGWSSLVVAEDGHRPVGPVVGEDFSGEAVVGWRPSAPSEEEEEVKVINILKSTSKRTLIR